MAQHIRASNLESRSARLKLPVAKKPVFIRIGDGVGLGYRRNRTAGTWIVEPLTAKAANWTKAFATADDFEEADGGSILNFWQAQDRARALQVTARIDGADDGKLINVKQASNAMKAISRHVVATSQMSPAFGSIFPNT